MRDFALLNSLEKGIRVVGLFGAAGLKPEGKLYRDTLHSSRTFSKVPFRHGYWIPGRRRWKAGTGAVRAGIRLRRLSCS